MRDIKNWIEKHALDISEKFLLCPKWGEMGHFCIQSQHF